jgi:hypothetical protein
MSIFHRLFWSYRVFGCFSATGVKKTLQKNVLQKKRVEKLLQKNRQKIQKNSFFSRLFITFWGVSR